MSHDDQAILVKQQRLNVTNGSTFKLYIRFTRSCFMSYMFYELWSFKIIKWYKTTILRKYFDIILNNMK